jgi:hypothetical protein
MSIGADLKVATSDSSLAKMLTAIDLSNAAGLFALSDEGEHNSPDTLNSVRLI